MTVFFFGGYDSTTDDVESWKASAIKQRPELEIEAFPYPVGATAGDPLARFHGSEQIAAGIKSMPLSANQIVGHSSGAAIANDIAARLLRLRAVNFRLVILDGFRPTDELLKFPGTECWSASCGGTHSRNYDALCGCPRFRVFEAKRCYSTWALHFSLVNLHASDVSVRSIADGYADCVANLAWLDEGG